MSANFTPNQNEYKNLTPFKCWLFNQINTWGVTNFPFVESDFDELTNYGMLMKMMKALHDVVSNQNEVEQDMTNLFGAFTELQSYVNNYFDNLDVQDEINNKLDEMVEQGTLQEIIADYLNSKAIFGFDTIEDMKQATNLIDGSYAKTLGYHIINDGGSSLYKIRQITNNDEVDDGLIIAMNDETLIAELIIKNNIISPEQFGAYGDNQHDDYNAIQKCIDAGHEKSCKIVMNKEYLIGTSLELYSDMSIDINKLTYNGNNDAIVLDSTSYVKLNIKELNTTRNGVTLKATTEINHNNIINVDYIYGDYNGIQMIAQNGIAYNKIYFSLIACDNYGIYLYSDRNTYSSSYIGENTIYGGRISKGVWGVYADGIGSRLAIPTLKLYNVALETPTNGIYFKNVENGLIDYPRFAEMGSSRIVVSFNEDCRNAVFNAVTPLYTSTIENNINYPTHKRSPILLNCPIAKTDGNTIGKCGQLYSSGLSIVPITENRMKTLSNETYSISFDDYQFMAFLISNDSVLNLNNSFGSHNIDSFIVTIAENKTLVIYDANNTKIFDNTSSPSGSYTKYKFYCEDNSGTDKWIYVTFPYTSV